MAAKKGARKIAGKFYDQDKLGDHCLRWELLRRSPLFRRHCGLACISHSAPRDTVEVLTGFEREFFRAWALPVPPSPAPLEYFFDPDRTFKDLLVSVGEALLSNSASADVRATLKALAPLIDYGGLQAWPAMPMTWLGHDGLNAVEVDIHVPHEWGVVHLLRDAIVEFSPPLCILKVFLIDVPKNAIRVTLALPGTLLPQPGACRSSWVSDFEKQIAPIEDGLEQAIRSAYPNRALQGAVAPPIGAKRGHLEKWLEALDCERLLRGCKDKNHVRTHEKAKAAISRLEEAALSRMVPETKLLLVGWL